MISKTPLIVGSIGLLALTACVDPNKYPDDPQARTRNGAVAGALIGGTLGATQHGRNRFGNALLGATLGGLVGGAIGNTLDQQAADLRSQMSNSTMVTNTGNSLVVTMPQDILFALDSANLRPDLQADLRAVSNNLLDYPDSTIEVVGHTDDSGSAAYNQDLSERRARAVAAVLRNGGVPGGRISAYGRGEDQPIASNQTVNGRAQNRRVEIIIHPSNR
ncbi:OmpA family protein [Rhodobacter ferrooxidans]|uniref:OmpA/MotB domain protein n=1 Tax=Rhodobacter ferrooxidans TaxID=371731 RepID=C8RYH1_9RHOB|nr:OmpA family protein [Rhodobacter sp. SW2]EEW26159.1 OmpA/MotB domain protein [Rhodobacter sp. SW2]